MKIIRQTIKYTLILIFCLFVSQNTHCNGNNNLIANNKTAYELLALASDSYLHYSFTGGATAQACSINGQKLCSILNKLVEQTRLFYKPSRDDLKELSKNAAIAFRNYDLSGKAADKKTFTQSLINLLQATLPLLENNDAIECRSYIKQLSMQS